MKIIQTTLHWTGISLVLACFACGKIDLAGERLEYAVVGKYQMTVPEPSGLALSMDMQSLWTVSDKNSTIYHLSLVGKILDTFKVNAKDIEGIAVVSDSVLCVLSEKNELIFLTHQGEELKRSKLENFGGSNVGYEGLAYDRVQKRFFLVKEKEPRLLIELDADLKETSRRELTFTTDLSGLDYDQKTGNLWLASDESRLVANLTSKGDIRSHFTIPFPQIEGIAYNPQEKTIYLVCDKEEQLFVLKLE